MLCFGFIHCGADKSHDESSINLTSRDREEGWVSPMEFRVESVGKAPRSENSLLRRKVLAKLSAVDRARKRAYQSFIQFYLSNSPYDSEKKIPYKDRLMISGLAGAGTVLKFAYSKDGRICRIVYMVRHRRLYQKTHNLK